MSKELSYPVVNINGTSRTELEAQCKDVYDALLNVQEALIRMTPNGRDYQTVGFDRFALARQQHLDRVRTIDEIKSEIYDIFQSLQS